MDVKSIDDLPNEVIEKFLMIYLSNNDVTAIGMIGIKRIKELADRVLEKRSKLSIRKIYNTFIFININSYFFIVPKNIVYIFLHSATSILVLTSDISKNWSQTRRNTDVKQYGILNFRNIIPQDSCKPSDRPSRLFQRFKRS